MSRNIEVELVAAISTENPLGGAIIVASDGTHDSDGAVRVGMALGRRDQVNAALLSVVEPVRFAEEHDGSSPADAERMTRLAIEAREGELSAQRHRTHPGRRSWPFAIHVGDRVDEIVTYARHNGASLIVLGLGSHGVIARLLQRETALRVSRAASVPVLAVPPDAWGVPHSVLAAIDFTDSSEDAARAAVELLGGEGTLYLAHVTPRVPIPQGDSRVWSVVPTGEIIGKGDMRAQIRKTCENIGKGLAYAGATFADVVTATTYVTDIEEYYRCSDERFKFFVEKPCASTLIQISRLGHPDSLVEITVEAIIEPERLKRALAAQGQ